MDINTYTTGQHVEATGPNGERARGEVISRVIGVGGGLFALEIKNPVSGIHTQVYLGTWDTSTRV